MSCFELFSKALLSHSIYQTGRPVVNRKLSPILSTGLWEQVALAHQSQGPTLVPGVLFPRGKQSRKLTCSFMASASRQFGSKRQQLQRGERELCPSKGHYPLGDPEDR